MRILLADDQRLMLECLKQAITRLEPAAEVVTAGSFPEAFGIASRGGRFSVILLDLHMPGMNGLDGLRKAVAAFPETAIAIITGMIHKSVAAAALGAGAKGFIPKNISTERLIGALETLADGEIYVAADLLIDPGDVDTSHNFGAESLTARERAVAMELVKGHSNKEIARVLEVREVTVKLHIRNMCRKLDARNRTQIVVRLMQAVPTYQAG